MLPASSSLGVLSDTRRVPFGISILLSTRGAGEQVVQGRSSHVQSPSAKTIIKYVDVMSKHECLLRDTIGK